MELWIRSQNKDFLEKCSGLYIAHTDDNIWSIINSITMTIYGKYKTKERALEVLDEIQNILKPNITLTKFGKIVGESCNGTVYSEPNEYDFKELQTYIYEMPKE